MSRKMMKRDRGQQKLFTPGLGRHGEWTREVSCSREQIAALQNLFETHPTLVAANAVLEARLLSGGLTLRRNGTPVDCSPEFREHLDAHWSRFARDLLRHFMIAGFAVVTYEKEPRDCATSHYRRNRRKGAVAQAKRLAERLFDAYTIPYVAPFPSYRVAWEHVGKGGYVRSYRVYRAEADAEVEPDEDVVLHIATPPDEHGNVNSPMSAVWSISHFVDGLVEQAALAEPARAQPALVTQIRPKDGKDGVSPADMFFDTESRGISRDQQEDDNAANARALGLQVQLCQMINQLNGSSTGFGPPRLGASIGAPNPNGPHASVAGRLLTLPERHEAAPHAPMPQTRPDLEPLLRLAWENMCLAMGTCSFF